MTDPGFQPDGAAALRVREQWLKQRRSGRLGDRASVALWGVISALVGWLGVVGFLGLSQ